MKKTSTKPKIKKPKTIDKLTKIVKYIEELIMTLEFLNEGFEFFGRENFVGGANRYMRRIRSIAN